jgi:hypothetical protein
MTLTFDPVGNVSELPLDSPREAHTVCLLSLVAILVARPLQWQLLLARSMADCCEQWRAIQRAIRQTAIEKLLLEFAVLQAH